MMGTMAGWSGQKGQVPSGGGGKAACFGASGGLTASAFCIAALKIAWLTCSKSIEPLHCESLSCFEMRFAGTLVC